MILAGYVSWCRNKNKWWMHKRSWDQWNWKIFTKISNSNRFVYGIVGIITVLINNSNMNRIASLVSGIVFGIGLTISEMINPAKVLGFLDLFGNWDPSLNVCNDWCATCLFTNVSSDQKKRKTNIC
jgi:hypothetical protein